MAPSPFASDKKYTARSHLVWSLLDHVKSACDDGTVHARSDTRHVVVAPRLFRPNAEVAFEEGVGLRESLAKQLVLSAVEFDAGLPTTLERLSWLATTHSYHEEDYNTSPQPGKTYTIQRTTAIWYRTRATVPGLRCCRTCTGGRGR